MYPDAERRLPGWKRYVNRLIAADISNLARYYDQLIQWLPRDDDTGLLLDSVEAPARSVVTGDESFPDLSDERNRRSVVLVNGTFNHEHDIQGRLAYLRQRLSRTTRLVVILYNPYLRGLYRLANWLGIRRGELPDTFITRVALENLARLAGYAIVRESARVYCPFRLLGLGDVFNRLLPLLPIVRWLSLTYIVTLRPVVPGRPSGVSCVIPARNERGNIENAIKRFPKLDCRVEILFVEGHSTDGTWDEIQRVAAAYGDRMRIKALRQTGRGKADAVRLGFAHAEEELLTILDADLTMPPERLVRFYEAWCNGHGDFINGSRLVYPMEGEAMRFLNQLGNVFFAKALSWVLNTRFSDSLCGTKMLTSSDYERMVAWRKDFGDFDPFGDFELLFPAAVLALDAVDVPVRYRARTYGTTNIHRFRHGWQLLRMTLLGLFRIKLGPGV